MKMAQALLGMSYHDQTIAKAKGIPCAVRGLGVGVHRSPGWLLTLKLLAAAGCPRMVLF